MQSQFVCYHCGTANHLVAQKAQRKEGKGAADCHICRMLNRSRCCFSQHKNDSNRWNRKPTITISKSVDRLPAKTARPAEQRQPEEINSPILMLKRPASTAHLSTGINPNATSQQIVYVPTQRKVIYYEPVIYQKLATPSTIDNPSTNIKKRRGLTQTRDLLARKLDFNIGQASQNGTKLAIGRPVPPEVLRQHIKDYLRPCNGKFTN